MNAQLCSDAPLKSVSVTMSSLWISNLRQSTEEFMFYLLYWSTVHWVLYKTILYALKIARTDSDL